MSTRKELLQKINDSIVNPFLKTRAKRLSKKNLEKLVETIDLVNAAKRTN